MAIFGLWHPGSGAGDQIFSYLATRTIAERLGVDFAMAGQFKCDSFMTLDKGLTEKPPYSALPYVVDNSGKIIVQSDLPIYEPNLPYFDPEFFFIKDNTIIDGCSLQDERYWDIEKVRQWLKVEPLEMPDDLCVLNIRGGEYLTVPDLILPREYWAQAIEMKKAQGVKNFVIHTDDPAYANSLFPYFEVIKDIELNWRSVRYAKHLILANSAFGILPALLNENVKEVIAPFGWNARNTSLTKWLGRPMNYYKKFTYV